MARQPKAAPKPEPVEATRVFDHDVCLYRSPDDARIFRKGEVVPDQSEGWKDHPSLTLKT